MTAQTSPFLDSNSLCAMCENVPTRADHNLTIEGYWLSLCEKHFQLMKQAVWNEVAKEFQAPWTRNETG